MLGPWEGVTPLSGVCFCHVPRTMPRARSHGNPSSAGAGRGVKAERNQCLFVLALATPLPLASLSSWWEAWARVSSCIQALGWVWTVAVAWLQGCLGSSVLGSLVLPRPLAQGSACLPPHVELLARPPQPAAHLMFPHRNLCGFTRKAHVLAHAVSQRAPLVSMLNTVASHVPARIAPCFPGSSVLMWVLLS